MTRGWPNAIIIYAIMCLHRMARISVQENFLLLYMNCYKSLINMTHIDSKTLLYTIPQNRKKGWGGGGV